MYHCGCNDATVKSRCLVSNDSKKNLRTGNQHENKLPIIVYLVDSAGVFLPMQDEIFSGQRTFRSYIQKQCCNVIYGDITDCSNYGGSCVLQEELICR